jgi:DNA repair protein RadC
MEQTEKLKIKDLALEDRPREKLLKKGVQALSDAEIIALLLGSGSRQESAVELARKILRDVNHNLNELGKSSLNELQQYNGVGEAKAVTIAAALELGKRRKLADIKHKVQIKSSRDIFERFHPYMQDLPHEEFWVVYMNRANKIIDERRISEGGTSGTVVDVKKVLKWALEKTASTLILCHNHPSGNLQPSKSDETVTGKMKQAAQIMEMQMLDHIIIGQGEYYSFADEEGL